MRRIIISIGVIVAAIAVVIGGLMLYIRGYGFSAREEPSWMERVVAQNARKIATPADAKTLKNPQRNPAASPTPRP